MNGPFKTRTGRLLIALCAVTLAGALWATWYALGPSYWVWRACRAQTVMTYVDDRIGGRPSEFDDEGWRGAVERLPKMGERSVAPLISGAESGDPETAKRCMGLLSRVGGDRACRYLISQLRSPDRQVAEFAAICLAYWGRRPITLPGGFAGGFEPERAMPKELRDELVDEALRLADCALDWWAQGPRSEQMVGLLEEVGWLLGGFDDPRIATWAKKPLQSADAELRSFGHEAIRSCSDPSLIPVLEKMLPVCEATFERPAFERTLAKLKGIERQRRHRED